VTDASDPGSPLYGTAVTFPTWAKTQNKLVVSVAYGTDHMPDLWIIDLTNPTVPTYTNLTDTPDSEELEASWSPDDLDLVFMAGDRKRKKSGLANFGAYVMPSDGSASRTLINGAAYSAVWQR
jgi:Tol biopolymer transport system component